jgi:hypothetical protein
MPTIRRLYVYALSAIALTVLGIGLSTLLAVAFHALGLAATGSSGFRDPQEDRRQLSLAAAMIGVGLPVWLLHWWLADRERGHGAAAWEPERRSAIRALYLTGVLAVTLIAGVSSAMELIRVIAWKASGVPTLDQLYADPGGALATLTVVSVAWAFHAVVRRRDLAAGPLTDAAAYLIRAYRYAAALIGLVVGLQGLADLLRLAGDLAVAPGALGAPAGPELASRLGDGAASLVAGLAVWGGHAWYSTRLASDPGWRGSAERGSRLRTGYVTAVIAGGAIGTVAYLVEAAGAPILLWTRAHDGSLPPIDGMRALRIAAVAILAAVPWLAAWRVHRAWLIREARDGVDADGGVGRIATAARLADHAAALVALGFAATGSAWLLGLLIDVALGGTRTAVGQPWTSELAGYLPAALLGSGLFAAMWRSISRRERADVVAEAASPIRRAALLLAIAASVVALLVSASLILYRLFSSIFGVQEPGSTVSILSTPLGVLAVAAVILAASAGLLRRDVRRVPAGTAPGLAGLVPGRGGGARGPGPRGLGASGRRARAPPPGDGWRGAPARIGGAPGAVERAVGPRGVDGCRGGGPPGALGTGGAGLPGRARARRGRIARARHGLLRRGAAAGLRSGRPRPCRHPGARRGGGERRTGRRGRLVRRDASGTRGAPGRRAHGQAPAGGKRRGDAARRLPAHSAGGADRAQ